MTDFELMGAALEEARKAAARDSSSRQGSLQSAIRLPWKGTWDPQLSKTRLQSCQ